jgi:hypothetical protein
MPHALEEMAADEIIQADVHHVLINGQVTLVEQKRDELWRVEGRNVDGRRITVIAAVYEQEIRIKVVTVWEDKRRGK